MIVLMKSIKNESFEVRKNSTLVIDDINALGKFCKSKDDLKDYFKQIYNLSRNAVNVICISNSDNFINDIISISEVSKYGMILSLPVPSV